MAVKLRLARHGSKKRPFYYIVAAQEQAPRDGAFLEKIGFYNPMAPKDSEERLRIDAEAAKKWLSTGAQPTDRVAIMFGNLGIIEKKAYRISTKKAEPGKKRAGRALKKAEKLASVTA